VSLPLVLLTRPNWSQHYIHMSPRFYTTKHFSI
jgi:hypothetical protein